MATKAQKRDHGLRCQSCGSDDLKVLYTRATHGNQRRRRRECRLCQARITTLERIILAPTSPAVLSVE
jgi:transcriptional regulator NrdR family protein